MMKKIDPNTGEEIKIDTRIYNDGTVLTQQSSRDECDINLIVAAAKRGADISHVARTAPMYGDFTGLPDYREAVLMVRKAEEMFMSLDAFVRERFGNDPGRLLDFLADDKNRDEAVKLGLVKPAEVAKRDEHLETLKSIDVSLKGKKGGAGHGKGSKSESDDELV